MKIQNQDNKITEFVSLVRQGIEAWVKAGEIVAQLIDEDAGNVDRICKACPELTPETVIRFDQIGRKKLHPKTLISDAPGIRKLRKLPFSIQDKYTKEPVDLLVKTDKGWETLNVDVLNLTQAQAEQAFARDGMRSAAAQRAWIEDRNAKVAAPPIQTNLPYRIVGKKIVIIQPCTFSVSEFVNILAEVER